MPSIKPGAIIMKQSKETEIKKCEFLNTLLFKWDAQLYNL